MRTVLFVLILALALTGCGKKKEKIDIVTELEPKPTVTEVKPEVKPEEKPAAPKEAEPEVVMNAPSPVSTDITEPAQPTQPAAPVQGYEVPAQKVTTPAVPQTPPAPYPPYQGRGYTPYSPPPKKYVPPGPIETAGEFIGHLVNPFKRKEDESKKTYQGI